MKPLIQGMLNFNLLASFKYARLHNTRTSLVSPALPIHHIDFIKSSHQASIRTVPLHTTHSFGLNHTGNVWRLLLVTPPLRPIMLDRSETILDTSHSDDSRAPLSKDETAAYIQESENDSPTAAGERASFPSTSDAQEPPQEPPSDVAGRHRSRSQHSTGSGSVSGSDLDLTEMRHDDPMYASANGRSSQDKLKLDTSRRGWTDMFDTEEPDTSMDRDSKEARRLGKKQFLQKTGINAILIGLWYILSISMSVVSCPQAIHPQQSAHHPDCM